MNAWIEFDYGTKFNKDEIKKLEELGIAYKLYDADDYTFRSGSNDEDETWKKFTEYLAKDEKELRVNRFLADPNFIVSELPRKTFRIVGSKEDSVSIVTGKLFTHLDVLKEYEAICTRIEAATKTFNAKCSVHIGGSLLITINKLMLLTDACTDAVQGALNSGWRIVAVTVQPDGRRPDYILGKCNDEPIAVSAERG
jgi:hypothetical protein